VIKPESTTASHGHPVGTVRENEIGPPRPGRLADTGEMVGVQVTGDDMFIFVTKPVVLYE
jgi:hypothetical protein